MMLQQILKDNAWHFAQEALKVSHSPLAKFSAQSKGWNWEAGALLSKEEEKGYSRSNSEHLNQAPTLNSHLEKHFYWQRSGDEQL